MAVVRARSSPPYGLITFVALWVISAGLAVFFYVKWTQTAQSETVARKDRDDAGKPAEMTQARSLFQVQRGQSLLGAANEQFMALRKDLSDSPSASAVDLDAQLKSALAAAGKTGKPAMQAINELAGEKKSATDQSKALETQVESLRTESRSVQQQADERLAKLASDLGEAQKQLAAALAAGTQSEEKRGATVAEYEAKITAAQQEAETRRRQSVLEVEQLRAENKKLGQQNQDYRDIIAKLKGGGLNVNAGEPDGRIVRANTAQGEVYIDLGTDARMTPGLTFTVYDPRLGVRFSTPEEALGKGSIEVIDVYPHNALCRITRTTKGQSIQINDMISNVVYHADKARTFHFVIYGDFDVDGDGVATSAERERLVRMIRDWGGVIDDDVTPQTDYVVVGERPASPMIKTEAAAQPGGLPAERAGQQDRYDQIISAAKQFGIPTLNANRFLAMIGYYNTTIVRP